MDSLLEMKGIVKKFGEIKALNNVSISISPGQILSLCGKMVLENQL